MEPICKAFFIQRGRRRRALPIIRNILIREEDDGGPTEWNRRCTSLSIDRQ